MKNKTGNIVRNLLSDDLLKIAGQDLEVVDTDDGALITIGLRDHIGKLIDVLEIETNTDGLIHPEEAIRAVFLTLNTVLGEPIWREASRRISQMKFEEKG